MADERLRRTAREAAAGDPRAEARHLLERVRAGTLDPEKLRVAAFLGHAAAREADPDAPSPPALAEVWERELPRVRRHRPRVGRLALERRYVERWFDALGELGMQVQVRAGFEAWKSVAARAGPDPARSEAGIVEAIEAWLRDPRDERAQACLVAADGLSQWVLERAESTAQEPRHALTLAINSLAYSVSALTPESGTQGVARAIEGAARAARLLDHEPEGDEPEDWTLPRELQVFPFALQDAIRSELVRWALG